MKLTTILLNLAKNVKRALYKIGLISDYIVENGITTASDGSYWIYEKMESGIAKCWGRKTHNINQYSTIGSSYGMWWCFQVDVNYPFTFIEKPIVLPDSTVATAFTITTIVESETKVDKVTIFSAVHTTSGFLDNFIRLQVIGRWK